MPPSQEPDFFRADFNRHTRFQVRDLRFQLLASMYNLRTANPKPIVQEEIPAFCKRNASNSGESGYGSCAATRRRGARSARRLLRLLRTVFCKFGLAVSLRLRPVNSCKLHTWAWEGVAAVTCEAHCCQRQAFCEAGVWCGVERECPKQFIPLPLPGLTYSPDLKTLIMQFRSSRSKGTGVRPSRVARRGSRLRRQQPW